MEPEPEPERSLGVMGDFGGLPHLLRYGHPEICGVLRFPPLRICALGKALG